MFIRDVKFKRGTVHDIHLAEAHLPVRLGHRDANRLYGAPLNAQLAAVGLGSVLECKLRKRANGAVIGVDIYLGLTDISKDALKTVTQLLEGLTAPLGSSIRLTDAPGTPLLFGRAEGIELSVDHEIAPDADSRRDLAGLCRGAIEELGVNRGWVESDGRTRLFFYSENYLDMKAKLARVLASHPKYADANLRRLA